MEFQGKRIFDSEDEEVQKRPNKITETPEERAIRIFKEDKEIQAERSRGLPASPDEQAELQNNFQRRGAAIMKHSVPSVAECLALKPKTLASFFHSCHRSIQLFRTEEEEYLGVNCIKHSFILMNEKFRNKYQKLASEMGSFDY